MKWIIKSFKVKANAVSVIVSLCNTVKIIGILTDDCMYESAPCSDIIDFIYSDMKNFNCDFKAAARYMPKASLECESEAAVVTTAKASTRFLQERTFRIQKAL